MTTPHDRPDRVLICTPIISRKLYAWKRWVEALAAQHTDLLWDILIIDNEDRDDPAQHPFGGTGYKAGLNKWAKSKPFGPSHRVRVIGFGPQYDGRIWKAGNDLYKVQYAESIAWDKFQRWSSYDHLMFLECDVIVPPNAIQDLYDANVGWAAAWMVSRRMLDPRNGKEVFWPLIFHGLTMEKWATAHGWDDIHPLGYKECPSEEPFQAVVTHLGCTFLRGEVVRKVPFMLATSGGDVTMSWMCAQAGYPPWCIPAVKCDHIAEHEV